MPALFASQSEEQKVAAKLGQTCFVSLGLLKTWAVLAVLSQYCWCGVRVMLGVKLESLEGLSLVGNTVIHYI